MIDNLVMRSHKSKIIFLVVLFNVVLPGIVSADERLPLDSLVNSDLVSVQSFVDTYFSDDFNNFKQRKRSYLTQPQVNDEANINLWDLSAKVNTEVVRAVATGQFGTSVDANYSAEEHEGIKYLQEGYVGVSPAEKLWVDVGVFLSHIGMENWRSRDNLSYTRSLIAEFSPYYESGVRVTYELSDATTVQLLAVNGWQNITHYDGRWAGGSLVKHSITPDTLVGWSTFIGRESDQNRLFNDLYLTSAVTDRIKIGAAFDIGYQDTDPGQTDWWLGWTALASYRIIENLSLVARLEQYVDRGNIIVSTPDSKPYSTIGYSFGADYEAYKNLLWRNEIRFFNARNQIYQEGEDGLAAADSFFVTSLSYLF